MTRKRRRLSPILSHSLLGLFLAGALPPATAADSGVAGKWRWDTPGFGGQTFPSTLELREGDAGQLTGTYAGGFGDPTAIEGGVISDGSISFKVTRSFGDRTFTSAFSGAVRGVTIVGSITIEGGNQPREIEWKAERVPDVDPTGLWKWTEASGRDGSPRDRWVTLRYAHGELTGLYRTGRWQVAIRDPKLDGSALSFAVERRFGDRARTTTYRGTLSVDGITGTSVSTRDGEERRLDWKAVQDTPEVEPAGTWVWTTRRQNGEPAESRLTLALEGGELTGSYSGRGGDAAIQDGRVEGDALSFKVVRENDRGSFTVRYRGKIDGDAIAGTAEVDFGQGSWKSNWTAQRRLPEADPAGTWTWTTRFGRDGESREQTLTLRLEEGRLTGVYAGFGGEAEITDAVIEGNDLSFHVSRSRGDRTFTSRFSGMVRGDKIVGTIQTVRDGDAPAPAAADWALLWTAQRKGS